MACIDDEEYGGKLRDPWFKFLGRFLLANLSVSHAQEVLLQMVTEAGETVEGAGLRGSQTVWIWDAYIMSMISWMLLIHDIAPSWDKGKLSSIQIRWVSKWLGFPHGGTNKSRFVRSKEHLGL